MFIYRKEKHTVPCENCNRAIDSIEERLIFKHNYIVWRLCNNCLNKMINR